MSEVGAAWEVGWGGVRAVCGASSEGVGSAYLIWSEGLLHVCVLEVPAPDSTVQCKCKLGCEVRCEV